MRKARHHPDTRAWDATEFLALLKAKASALHLLSWLSAHPPRSGLSLDEWLSLVPPIANSVAALSWMTETERVLLQQRVLTFVREAFTVARGPVTCFGSALRDRFADFIEWLKAQTDEQVVHFCWDLLADDLSFTPAPVFWLRNDGRIADAHSFEFLELAVTLKAEADAMYWWPPARWRVVTWDGEARPYHSLLTHESYLVRGAAALVLGRMYVNLKTIHRTGNVPDLAIILATIQEHETRTPGVAGPFLCGAGWSVEVEAWDVLATGFDMKRWFLDTLRRSRRETKIPHIQSLEFYAHEFFCSDGEAILGLLRMGRKELALLTATEEPTCIPQLLPVLEQMAASGDADVERVIREYLRRQSHHAGLGEAVNLDEDLGTHTSAS
jgi:hypothetical protein